MSSAPEGLSAASDSNDGLNLDFDPKVLREKYRTERDKRIRPDGNDQYVEIKNQFSHYLEDPYTDRIEREPLTDEIEVVVIGGGFGGLLTAARLRQAGVEEIRIIERGGDFGGTWYWNRYPGAQCDIESYIYLPLLEEVGYIPKEKYSFAPEILSHARAIAKTWDLYRDACFQTSVTELQWNEERARWIVSTDRGDRIHARFVAASSGPLDRPKLPGIPGVDSYRGHSFHTSRWDYEYTGGDSTGNLNRLSDKRIGVIGTGATAVQCIPHLGETAKHLYVFQRTPSSIDERGNSATDPTWAESLEAGWQQRRKDNFNSLMSGGVEEEDLVNDGWTDLVRNLMSLVTQKGADVSTSNAAAQTMEIADFQKMNSIRARVDKLVENSTYAEALKPWYRQFCKRPCMHDDYLPTFNRPNVTLVDTDGRGVERITENSVVANGQEYEIDCLIYATGFEVNSDFNLLAGYPIIGKDGVPIRDKWKDGVETLHGMHVRGYPNLFIIQSTIQTGLTPNFTHTLDEASKHVAYIIDHARQNDLRTIETSQEAQSEWVQTVVDLSMSRQKFLEQCTPGYYNNEGQPIIRPQNQPYGGGSPAFFKMLEDWRATGELKGLDRVPNTVK